MKSGMKQVTPNRNGCRTVNRVRRTAMLIAMPIITATLVALPFFIRARTARADARLSLPSPSAGVGKFPPAAYVQSPGPAPPSLTAVTTPLSMAPGAPLGSFALSGFDNVNLYNGNLNFNLPLLHVGGRGSAGYTMTLPFNSKRWSVVTQTCAEGPNCPNGVLYLAGDQIPYDLTPPGYSPGVLIARTLDVCTGTLPQGLTTLTFIDPQGTEHSLIDTATQGNFIPIGTGEDDHQCISQNSRGVFFDSMDGSFMTFFSCDPSGNAIPIADTAGVAGVPAPTVPTPAGFLMFKDGTRYRIDGGSVTYIEDRNGNRTTFTYGPVTTITDSLGRQITIAIGAAMNPNLPYDTITYPGFNGATRTITVNYAPLYTPGGVSLLRPDFTQQVPNFSTLFPSLSNGNESYNPTLVSSVQLPETGLSYTFLYNPYAEVARVNLPTGGAYEYDYTPPSDPSMLQTVPTQTSAGNINNIMVYRRLVARRTYSDPANPSTYSELTDYSQDPTTTQLGSFADQQEIYQTEVSVTHYGPSGSGLLAAENHYFQGNPLLPPAYPNVYSPFKDGKEFQTDSLATDGVTVLRSKFTDWKQLNPVNWWATETPPIDNNQSPENNPFVADTSLLLEDASPNLKMVEDFSYDQFNNVTDDQVYDYAAVGSGPGPLLRDTQTAYIESGNYTYVENETSPPPQPPMGGAHLRNLVQSVTVYSGIGQGELAQTMYQYDGATPADPTNGGSINVTGYDPAFSTIYSTRGNATTITRGIGGDATTTTIQYDLLGNMTSFTDGLGNTTNISYSDDFGLPGSECAPTGTTLPNNNAPASLAGAQTFAFPTMVTNPAGQILYNQYDYGIGKPVAQQDVNGVVSAASYCDPLDRPTQLIRAISFPSASLPSANLDVETQTSIAYNDFSRTITTTSDLSSYNDNVLSSIVTYDGLGRTTQTSKSAPEGNILTTETYDGMGRVYTVTNPYLTTADPTYGTTTTGYDALSRVMTVATTDVNNNPTGTITTTYATNVTTVTDQQGKARSNTSDALGRLTSVTEDPSGANYTGLNYVTTYQYDALSNLKYVGQGGDALNNGRQFSYDSLSRLVTATNPREQVGSTTYTYDADSNLHTRLDPNGITTTYSYDALNRIQTRTYSDGVTPAVSYTYDGNGITPTPPFSVGRLTAMSSSVSASDYTAYDPVGRVAGYAQVTNGVSYPMSYTYNLAGEMLTETYPSGRMVTDQYDTAGRVSKVASGSTKYRQSFTYAPFGGIQSVALGNTLSETTSYNSRLQPVEIQLGASGSLFDLKYTYQTSSATSSVCGSWPSLADNGNVLEEKLTVASTNGSYVWDQNYTYDGVNRLCTAAETFTPPSSTPTPVNSWSRAFGYDNAGNMWVNSAGSFGIGISPGTPQGQRAYNQLSLLNRLTAPANYDNAGNLTRDLVNDTYTYDAENKQTSCSILNESSTVTTTASYSYDGDGHRIMKAVTAPVNGTPMTTTTTFVYNANGALVAEYGGPGLTDSGTSYLTTDHLRSTRVVTDGNGNPRRHDFLPFGEEINTAAGLAATGRSAVSGYASSEDLRQRFTSKERDAESTLDLFGARYYSSVEGRFNECDPYNPMLHSESGQQFDNYLAEPRNWNKYAYVWNNPSRYIDPNGEDVYVVTYTTGNSEGDAQFKQAAQTRANDIRNSKGFNAGSDTVIVRGVRTKADFEGVIKEANQLNEAYGGVRELSIFGHSGVNDGPEFHEANSRTTEHFESTELAKLNVNWTSNAQAFIFGCNSAQTFAQKFANATGVPTWGFGGYASFSASPNVKDYRYILPFYSGPLYMMQKHTTVSVGTSEVGAGPIFDVVTDPMVRRDPVPGTQK